MFSPYALCVVVTASVCWHASLSSETEPEYCTAASDDCRLPLPLESETLGASGESLNFIQTKQAQRNSTSNRKNSSLRNSTSDGKNSSQLSFNLWGVNPATGKTDASWVFQRLVELVIGILDLENVPVEGSHTVKSINIQFVFVSIGILLIVGVAYLFERRFYPKFFAENLMPLWLIVLFATSYIALVPGISMMLFSVRMIFIDPKNHMHVDVIVEQGTFGPTPVIKETMFSLVHFLFQGGNWPAGILVAFYGFGVPVAKLVLLVAVAIYRRYPEKALLHSQMVHWIQFISKFDSPKLLCYALIKFIVGSQNYPGLVETTFHLDVGYMYYFVFCIFTLVGALLIPCELPENQNEKVPPLLVRRYKCDPKGIFMVMAILTAAFAVVFYFGSFTGFMSVSLDFVRAAPTMMMNPFFNLGTVLELNMSSWTQHDISLWLTVQTLSQQCFQRFEANSFLAWLLMAIFVLVFTVLDMAVLLYVSFLLWQAPAKSHQQRRALWLMKVAHWLKYLSMLDVAAIGIAIMAVAVNVTFAGAGISISPMPGGLLGLVIAEVLHYAAYYSTAAAVKYFIEDENCRFEGGAIGE